MKTSSFKRSLLSLGLICLCSLSVSAQLQPIPVDEQVRIGQLDNGLTYYIRHNDFPEHRASFLIAQKVGSLEEEDNQRGLAHFLEHMCFNGTEHFPGNSVIEYLRTLGVEFGANLNAFTSIERTVYYIDKVPTQRTTALDSCMLILKDWSCGLSLEDKEIDKERGVIKEEWRMTSDARSRMLESKLPELYPNNKYGYRMPIGTMDVVQNFKYQELKDYYKRWYHPSNQGIIIVGDIDVDQTEAKLKTLFADVKNPEGAEPVAIVPVADNAQPIVVMARDKETLYDTSSGQQMQHAVMLMFKHEATQRETKGDLSYFIQQYVMQAATAMLNERLSDAAQEDNCPYLNASVDNGDYLISSSVSCIEIAATPKDAAHDAATLKEIMKTALRASEQGFTETEYTRFKENYMAQLETQKNNKASHESLAYGMEYVEHFLAGEPIPSIDVRYAFMKKLSGMIPVAAVNQAIARLITKEEANTVVLCFDIESAGATYPTKEQLLQAMAEARSSQFTAYVDNAVSGSLIKALPKAGSIIKEKQDTKLGFTELLLSNGVKVFLKKTDFKKDEVLFSGEGNGGASFYGEKDYPNLALFDKAIEASGLGGLTSKDLEKALSGKKVSIALEMPKNGMQMKMGGQTRVKDVETLLQLVYLYFTDITKDEKSFDRLLKQEESDLSGRDSQPMLVFQDSLMSAMSGHNPRVLPLTNEQLRQASYDRILEMAKERLSSADGWEFNLIGNYDETSIKQLICQYLGSLPADRKNAPCPRAVTLIKGMVESYFNIPMETPMSIAAMIYMNQDMPYTLEGLIQTSMIGNILTQRLLKTLREEQSMVYSAESVGTGDVAADGLHYYQLVNACPVDPAKTALAMGAMQTEVKNLCSKIDAETLDKVKKQMQKQYEENLKSNIFWGAMIENYRKHGVDMTAAQQVVEAQTPEKLQAFMTEFLKSNNVIFLSMGPK